MVASLPGRRNTGAKAGSDAWTVADVHNATQMSPAGQGLCRNPRSIAVGFPCFVCTCLSTCSASAGNPPHYPLYTGERPMSHDNNDEQLARGLDVATQVYGDPALTKQMASFADQPFSSETMRHLFADIWSRPGLSIRDRRLLVIGATTMLGRADLL